MEQKSHDTKEVKCPLEHNVLFCRISQLFLQVFSIIQSDGISSSKLSPIMHPEIEHESPVLFSYDQFSNKYGKVNLC